MFGTIVCLLSFDLSIDDFDSGRVDASKRVTESTSQRALSHGMNTSHERGGRTVGLGLVLGDACQPILNDSFDWLRCLCVVCMCRVCFLVVGDGDLSALSLEASYPLWCTLSGIRIRPPFIRHRRRVG